MEPKKIRQYAELLKEMDLTALEIQADGTVRLERNPAVRAMSASETLSARTERPAVPVLAAETDTAVVTSPMVGVFYIAPQENAEPFVQVGTAVKRGDVLCIIEAMKLMNEITVEFDGTVTEVLTVNGAVVEYGQPLFRVRKELL